MRLIDADAIAPKLEGKFNQDYVRYAPTIDAVPVVRCAECKHGCKSVQESVVFCQRDGRKGYEMVFKPGDFCSYGERRSDD